MIKKIIYTTLAILAASFIVFLYVDHSHSSRYRTAQGGVYLSRMLQNSKRCSNYNQQGLENARFSASRTPSLSHMMQLRDRYDRNFLVVSGRHQPDYFINHTPLNSYCLDIRDGKLIDVFEKKSKPAKRSLCFLRRILNNLSSESSDISSEKLQPIDALLQRRGIPYAAPLPHSWLQDWSYVPALISLFEAAKASDTYIHFYCKNGKGRSTTLVVLYDIYLNPTVPLHDIIERHYCMGGEDLQNVKPWSKGTWTATALENRYRLVKAFYDYMNVGYGQQSWGGWLEMQAAEDYENLSITTQDVGRHRI